jgi:uncharacterized repeat protein (TIGR01451 family)
LTDTIYGNLFDGANANVTNNTCLDLSGDSLAAGASVNCTFQGEVTGNAGDSETDVVTVTAEDDEGNEATDDDDAEVLILTAPTGGTLGNFAWIDNGNGVQGPGDTPLSNLVVQLFQTPAGEVVASQNGTLVATTTTDSNGSYLFTDLPPGTYFVEFVRSDGLVFTLADQGDDDTIDSDGAAPFLQIAVTTQVDAVLAGEKLTHTITFSNVGTVDSSGVTLETVVPENSTIVLADNPGWACDGNATVPGTRCVFTVGNLAINAQGSVLFVVVTNAGLQNATEVELEVSIQDEIPVAPTQLVTLAAGEVNLTLDGGLVPEAAIARDEARTVVNVPPTAIDPGQQPTAPACGATNCLFLPRIGNE